MRNANPNLGEHATAPCHKKRLAQHLFFGFDYIKIENIIQN